jgi:hypothetical protein
MRPGVVSTLPADNSKCLYEPKLDGYRAIAIKNGGSANLFSMEGRRFDERFPRVLAALNNLAAKSIVLDGELVAVEPSGRPNFNELQNAASFSPFMPGRLWSAYGSRLRRLMEQLYIRHRKTFVPQYSLALLNIGLERCALQWFILEHRYTEHDDWLSFALVDPKLGPVRNTERFQC